MATLRAHRRLSALAATVAAAAAYAMVAAARGSSLPLVALVSVGAVGTTLVGLAAMMRQDALLGTGLALLGAEYGLALVGRGPSIDLAAPLAGALLLTTAELASWAASLHDGVAIDSAVVRAAWVGLVGSVAGGGLLALLALLIASALPGAGGTGLDVATGTAVIALVLCVTALRRRASARPDATHGADEHARLEA